AAVLRDSVRTELPSIPAVDRSAPLALSFGQQGLWFLAQLEGTSEADNLSLDVRPDRYALRGAYNISLPLRLDGALDVVALSRSVEELVRRHEALRTRFEAVGGRPVQVIEPVTSVEMPLIDLS